MSHSGEQILRPSRWKTSLPLFVSLAFVAIGILVMDGSWMALLAIAFFGLGSLVFVVTILPGATHLRLHADGFEMRTLFKTSHCRWSDIGEIGVTSVYMNRMVAFNFAEPYRSQHGAVVVSRALTGWDGALPDTYGMSARDLAALMTTYRDRARVRDATP
ncbi:MAG TPA: hypothetical protein VGF24_08100 [Vicinamibacterales bacterium]